MKLFFTNQVGNRQLETTCPSLRGLDKDHWGVHFSDDDRTNESPKTKTCGEWAYNLFIYTKNETKKQEFKFNLDLILGANLISKSMAKGQKSQGF